MVLKIIKLFNILSNEYIKLGAITDKQDFFSIGTYSHDILKDMMPHITA
jgi:hypothetical protein